MINGMVGAGTLVALTGRGAAGVAARPGRSDGDDGGVTPPPAGGPARATEQAVGEQVRLENNWAQQAGPSLDALATTTTGARLIDAYRASGAPIEVKAGLGTPAQYEYRITTRGNEAPVTTPTRIAIQPDALADAATGATLLGHELTHFVVHSSGTSLHDAVEGASKVSDTARRVMDETVSYTVQRELTEQLQPRPTPTTFTYESHSSDIDGFARDGSPKFTRRSLVETFDAVAADPTYARAFDITPGELAAERPAIIAALRATAPALAEWVPEEHISVE